jgi:hypothetical protein
MAQACQALSFVSPPLKTCHQASFAGKIHQNYTKEYSKAKTLVSVLVGLLLQLNYFIMRLLSQCEHNLLVVVSRLMEYDDV